MGLGSWFSQIDWWQVLELIRPYAILLIVALGSSLAVKMLIRVAVRFLFQGFLREHQEFVKSRIRGPVYFLVPVLAMHGVALGSVLDVGLLQRWLSWGLIGGFGWLVVRAIDVGAELIIKRNPIDIADNRFARSVQTQVQVFKRLSIFLVILLTIASLLLTFESVRHVGATLFASAGVAGLVVGIAARPSLSSFIAGIQLALTHPIRIDDVLIVEGEWGRVEEITSTYVVVKIWDWRRLVLPITYFTEKPFQNWTRTSSELIGTVFLYADYSVDVDDMRRELKEIVESTDLWDRNVCVLQVTEANEKGVQLRALVTSKDAPTGWDLRCYVRERLVNYLKRNRKLLPRYRAEINDQFQSSDSKETVES